MIAACITPDEMNPVPSPEPSPLVPLYDVVARHAAALMSDVRDGVDLSSRAEVVVVRGDLGLRLTIAVEPVTAVGHPIVPNDDDMNPPMRRLVACLEVGAAVSAKTLSMRSKLSLSSTYRYVRRLVELGVFSQRAGWIERVDSV